MSNKKDEILQILKTTIFEDTRYQDEEFDEAANRINNEVMKPIERKCKNFEDAYLDQGKKSNELQAKVKELEGDYTIRKMQEERIHDLQAQLSELKIRAHSDNVTIKHMEGMITDARKVIEPLAYMVCKGKDSNKEYPSWEQVARARQFLEKDPCGE